MSKQTRLHEDSRHLAYPDAYVLWGKRADYANGEWIKLAGDTKAECAAELERRLRYGWINLAVLRVGEHPED